MRDIEFMRQAIANAVEAIALKQIPVGSVLVREGKVILKAHNTVWLDGDPTAHAEMNAIRRGAKHLGNIDLSGCSIYCTLEPCPMCLSASHWARIGRIVYGADIADAMQAGFSELSIPAADMVRLGRSPLKIQGGLLADECRQLFQQWRASGGARPY